MATLTTSYQKLGTISISTYSQLRIYGKYNSQSTSGNTSNISIQLRLYGNGGSGSFSSGSCGISGIYNHTSGTTSYSTNLGSTSYSKGSEKTLATYTYSVNHSATGTYSDTITYRISSLGTVSGSGSASIALPTIKRVATMSSSNDFTDESPPTITFSNPGGFTVYPYLIIKNSSGTTLLDYSYDTGYRTAVTSPYTWSFTRPAINSTTYSSMLEEILATCNTSNTYNVTLGIDTYNGSTKLGYSSLSNTMTIVNANPTVDSTNYEETDVALTTKGYTDFSYCITNESKPSVEVSCSTLKSANVSSVVVSTSSTTSGYIPQSITLSYDSTSGTYKGLFGTITGTLTDISFITTVTDSRGNKATSTYTPILLNYKSISISSLEATRSNSTSGTITVKASGTWYGGTMLDDETNPCNIAYGIIEKDSGSTITYIDIDSSNITLNALNNTWSINYTLPLEYSYQKAWSLTLTAGDLYNDVRKETTILKGIPTMSLGENDMQVNGDLFVSGTSQIQNGLYCRPTGQVNTPVGNSMLIIKRATNSEAPNNGVVLEFGYSTNWTGQLFIGDNATQGIYYNGWSNGVRGSWIKLASQNDLAKNIITMQLTGSQSFGNAYTKLNLSAGTTIGTKLSVSSNQVRIGSGVNHIKVSATFGYNYTNAGMRYLRITKNFNTSSIDTTTIALQQKYENNTNHVGTLAITDVVISVSEGDLIGMYVYGLNGDSVRYTTSGMIQTNMTIEVID